MNDNTPTPNEIDAGKRQAIIAFVGQHPDGVIATVTPEGDPQASTVYFSIDDDLNIFFTTKQQTRKAQNIGNHAKVSVAIHDAASQTVVKASGPATEITDPQKAADAYRKTVHSAQTTGPDSVPPIARLSAGDFVIFQIKPEFIDMLGYGRGDNYANALKHATDTPSYGNPN